MNESQWLIPEVETGAEDGGTPFDPTEYLRLLLRRWPLIAVATALGLGFGLFHYFTTPKLYRAEATIQIEQPTAFSLGGTLNPWLETWAGMKYYPTQHRLLQSRGLAERTIDQLGLVGDPVFDSRTDRALLDQMSALERDALRARLANKLLGSLTIQPIEPTELVELRFVSPDPELAARITNGLATTYIEWGIEERSEDVFNASSFIDQQIEEIKTEIDAKASALRDQGRDVDIVTLDPESNDLIERINSLNQSYSQAIADRVEAESRHYELRASPPESIADANPTAAISEARNAFSLLQREYDAKLAIYKEDHPVMLDLDTRIVEAGRNLAQVIRTEADVLRRKAYAEYQIAQRRERSLKTQLDSVREEAMELNSVAVDLKNLEAEIGTRRELLDELLRRQSETGMSARLQSRGDSNVRLVDRALPPASAFRPSLRNDLSSGLGLGLVLGIGLVLLLHYLDRSIKSAEELERLLGLPVLAVIPDMSSSGNRRNYGYGRGRSKRGAAAVGRSKPGDKTAIELVPLTRPRIGVSEAYRSLRTGLLLSTAGGIKVISVTSAQAGEGKTATAANLAVVMAQLGRSTLLVDADLRKARLHQVLGVSNRVGLVNAIAEGADPASVIQPTKVENLSLCPSGPHPPNPSELLASERMGEFVQAARQQFDVVIIDTPPVMAVTDAILAGRLSEGTVLVFRASKVQREEARTCRDRLRMAEVRILGTILNCYNPVVSGDYDRRYYYYYSSYEDYAAGDADAQAGTAA